MCVYVCHVFFLFGNAHGAKTRKVELQTNKKKNSSKYQLISVTNAYMKGSEVNKSYTIVCV